MRNVTHYITWCKPTRPWKESSEEALDPFPHMDAFWCLCSRRIFENIVIKEEIAQNEQFLFFPLCFPLLVIGCPFNYRDFFIFLQNMFKVACCRIIVWGKGLNILSNYFLVLSIILHSFIEIFHLFCLDVFKMVCCIFVLCEKGFRLIFLI